MKKFAMLMLCLVLVFALAACAGTDTTPQGSVSDTVTVYGRQQLRQRGADRGVLYAAMAGGGLRGVFAAGVRRGERARH